MILSLSGEPLALNGEPINLPVNSILVGEPAVVIAKKNILFSALGINAQTMNSIYKIGNPNLVYRSDLTYNQIQGFEINVKYLIYPKTGIDLQDSVISPTS